MPPRCHPDTCHRINLVGPDQRTPCHLACEKRLGRLVEGATHHRTQPIRANRQRGAYDLAVDLKTAIGIQLRDPRAKLHDDTCGLASAGQNVDQGCAVIKPIRRCLG